MKSSKRRMIERRDVRKKEMEQKRVEEPNLTSKIPSQNTAKTQSKKTVAIEEIVLPDDFLNQHLSTEDQIASLNMVLGNYIDKLPASSIIEEHPADGTGTAFIQLMRFAYNNEDHNEEPLYILETGYLYIDMTTGDTGEPNWDDTMETFDTFEEAYKYAVWLHVNA